MWELKNGYIGVDSTIISKSFHLRHSEVLRKARVAGGFSLDEYKSKTGQMRTCYHVSLTTFLLIVRNLDPKYRAMLCGFLKEYLKFIKAY